MAVVMTVAIHFAKLPKGGNLELESLLLAGAIGPVALGDGPLSVAIQGRHRTAGCRLAPRGGSLCRA